MRQTLSPLSTSSLRRLALGLVLLAGAATTQAEPRRARLEADQPHVAEIFSDLFQWLIADFRTGDTTPDSVRPGHAAEESEIDTEIEVDPPNPPRR